MSADAGPSPLESLPRNVATSLILPYISSDDWLNLRAASRGCHEIVHGTADVNANFCPMCQVGGSVRTSTAWTESESLWRLALERDYRFTKLQMVPLIAEANSDEGAVFHQCLHSPANQLDRPSEAFLSTCDVFNAVNSYVAWKHWRRIDQRLHRRSPREKNVLIPSSEKVVGPYFLRACAMWRKIECWCEDESRSGSMGKVILSSLSPGRALDPNVDGRIEKARTSAMKAVYSFYAGQRDPMMEAPTDQPHRFNPFTGLFGGFQVYDNISCMRFMEPELDEGSSSLVIAQCYRSNKTIALDLETGDVNQLVETRDGRTIRLEAAGGNDVERRDTSNVILRGDYDDELESETQAMRSEKILRWFEEHANRLHRKFYSVGNIVKSLPQVRERFDAILRYPTAADTANCSRAVTKGVEVLASSIFVPEAHMFVYSIRVRLLAPGDDGYETPEQRGFGTCQLFSRHWIITNIFPGREPETETEEVRGEGVIGFYPLLLEGKYVNYIQSGPGYQQIGDGVGSFQYQSCTGATAPKNTIEGYLQFRPGSLDSPSGEAFNVRVAPFPCDFDNFLY